MTDTHIRRRHLFYLSGFDPRGVRHYYGLYRNEAKKQAPVTGHAYDISPRRRVAPFIHRWDVVRGDCRTVFDFLSWDDIVRREWPSGVSGIWKDIVFFCRFYLMNGHVWKFGRDKPARLLAGFYPLGVFVVSVLLGLLSFYACLRFLPLPWFLQAIAGAAAGYAVFSGGLALGHKFAAFWISRAYAFGLRWIKGDIPALHDRLQAFMPAIRAAAADPAVEEVLVVAHSIGAVLSMPMLAAVLADMPDGDAAKISIATVGGCIPLASFWRPADDYRAALSAVAHDRRVTWVDYAFPADGASFPHLDLLEASGMARQAHAGPRKSVPRFDALYHPERYRALRFNWYKLHFLYLMAVDVAGHYDFFDMTAGPRRLSAVFQAGGMPSPKMNAASAPIDSSFG